MRTSGVPLCTLVALAACAPQTYRIDAGALFAQVDGRIALQNAGGSLVLGQEMNDFDDQLGLGDVEGSPYLRLQWDHELHRVRVHGFGVDAEGGGVLAGDYGGIVAGSQVTTAMEFFAGGVSYDIEVWGNRNVRLAVGAQLGVYALDVAVRSGVGREEVQTELIAPMPFASLETYFGPVTFGASAGLIGGDLRDADGRYLDAEGFARVQVTDEIELIGGYRYLVLDANGMATSRDFDADLAVQGVFFGGGIRF